MARRKRGKSQDAAAAVFPVLVLGAWWLGVAKAIALLIAIAAVIIAGLLVAKHDATRARLPHSMVSVFDKIFRRGSALPTEWSLDLIRRLEWRRFEELCAGYFEKKGYEARFSGAGADGGVDIYLYWKGESDKVFGIVQCKSWRDQLVGVKELREFFGVMHHIGCKLGIYISASGYTPEATTFSAGKEIDLVDAKGLLTLIHELPSESQISLLEHVTRGDYTTPSCPSCEVKLVKRERKDGTEFWGCPKYPGCRYTMNVRNDETA